MFWDFGAGLEGAWLRKFSFLAMLMNRGSVGGKKTQLDAEIRSLKVIMNKPMEGYQLGNMAVDELQACILLDEVRYGYWERACRICAPVLDRFLTEWSSEQFQAERRDADPFSIVSGKAQFRGGGGQEFAVPVLQVSVFVLVWSKGV